MFRKGQFSLKDAPPTCWPVEFDDDSLLSEHTTK